MLGDLLKFHNYQNTHKEEEIELLKAELETAKAEHERIDETLSEHVTRITVLEQPALASATSI